MFSNCANRLWPSVSAVMPVPSEIKKADRFICALGPSELVTILGYDRRDLPAASGPHSHLFSRSRPYRRYLLPWSRSEEHTSELQSLMRISYAVFCLKTKNIPTKS